MSFHEMTKTAFRKTNRSGFDCLLTSVLPMNHKFESWFDILGGATMVSLSVAMVGLARFFLAN